MALSGTKSGQILQEGSSDVTVTVACLINAGNDEARSGGAETEGRRDDGFVSFSHLVPIRLV